MKENVFLVEMIYLNQKELIFILIFQNKLNFMILKVLKSTSKIIEFLQKLNVEFVDCKKIHLILYFLQGQINFEAHEYKVFKEILKYKTKVIFLKIYYKNHSKSFYIYQKENLLNNIKCMYKKLEKELYDNNKSRKEINEIRDFYIKINIRK